jgi:hypothetical protein
MKQNIVFLNLILSVIYLSSCSAISIKPKGLINDVNYRVIKRINGERTVKIISQVKSESLHWVYLNCNYIFGCYMSCEGPVNSCMKVAALNNFQMKYIMTRKKGHSSPPKCNQYC